MSKNTTIPVRLSDEQVAAIQRLATEHDVTDAQVIRWAVKALFRYIEHHDGKLVMPFDYDQLWRRISRDIVAEDPPRPLNYGRRRGVPV